MESLETRLRNAPIRTRTFDGTLVRIAVVLLLMLLALPVFYLGLLGIYTLFWPAVSPHSVVLILPPVLVVLSAFGTLLSFRYVPLTAGALAAFYLGWAFGIYPFPDLLPDPFFYWARVTMIAMLGLNLAWIVWSHRGRLARRG
ncbi:MAG: hypothetical protein OXL37_02050 [Chloroflexota bacterium]|nr:hypothetical protein [Chloroflexota bacterium]MDE2961491.1 hypothetical protein [Chloroflexota bacterium]